MDRINSNGSIARTGSTAIYLVIGWVAAVLSLVRYPFIFGLVGVILGILANKKGSKAAMPLIVASIILMAVGLIFSGVIFNYLRRTFGL